MADLPEFQISGMRVTASRDEVDSFAAAIGEPNGGNGADGIPFSFPVRWMAGMNLREAVYGLVDNEDGVFFVTLQSLRYHEDLKLDTEYEITGGGRLLTGRGTMVDLEFGVFDADGHRILTMTSKLGFAPATGAWTPPS